MSTTLRLPRRTPRRAPATWQLAGAIAVDLDRPLSWVSDLERRQVVVDLGDTDPDVVAAWCRTNIPHGIDYEIHPHPPKERTVNYPTYAEPKPTTSSYVYVASSWRNNLQPVIVDAIRMRGVEAYDFKNPAPGEAGFAWSEIDPDWQNWTAQQYVAALEHPVAQHGYGRDFSAMERADVFVLVLPCGRSAHLELGWAVGAGKRTAILTRDGEEPELMAKMVDLITDDVTELLEWVEGGGDRG